MVTLSPECRFISAAASWVCSQTWPLSSSTTRLPPLFTTLATRAATCEGCESAGVDAAAEVDGAADVIGPADVGAVGGVGAACSDEGDADAEGSAKRATARSKQMSR